MALEKQMKTPEAEGTRQSAVGTPSASRRKLVKGAFAAPMILTLHSGAAVAATSNTPTVAVIDNDGGAESTDALAPNVCIIPDTDTNGGTAIPACFGVDNPTSGDVFKCDSGKSSTGVTPVPATIKDCIGTNDTTGEPNNQGALIVTATSAASLIQIP